MHAWNIVDDDEVLQGGDCGLLNITLGGVGEGGEGGGQRADVRRRTKAGDEEEVLDFDEVQGAYLRESAKSAEGTSHNTIRGRSPFNGAYMRRGNHSYMLKVAHACTASSTQGPPD